MKQIIRNESGLGLIEVMAAAAIMMIIILGVTAMMDNQQTQINSMKAQSSYVEVSNRVRSVATSEASVIHSMKIKNDRTVAD